MAVDLVFLRCKSSFYILQELIMAAITVDEEAVSATAPRAILATSPPIDFAPREYYN